MPKKNDEALLKRIRDRYKYAAEQWREAQEERRKDMRYLQGDPWDEKDRKAREDAGRPTINHDELGQYVLAATNNVRENKRGIKVSPDGNGATDKTADNQENLIRTIEKNSRAPFLYCKAFQDMIEGSYGFFRVSRQYVSDESFDQEIILRPIANPDSVLIDWDCKEPDWSDQQYAFVLDPIRKEEFELRWPNAEVTSFSNEEMRIAPEWIREDEILTAEYWEVETVESYTLYQLADGTVTRELPKGAKAVHTRTVDVKGVVQYWTNGVEILERNPQPGKLIALIPMIGLERWVDDGAGSKRVINSLIRLARDPQMSLAYLNSQQMEEAGLSPKAAWVGYKGQFESDAEAWATSGKIPHSTLQADPMVDGATGQVLPLPTRVPFTPNFQEYEIAKDSARRAVQAAMGISPLPTAAQRNNEKSGVALERITDAQNLGSYHFVDSFDRALTYAGRVILDWIPSTYDTQRELSLRKADDSHTTITINTPEPYLDERTQQPVHFDTAQGDHYPDISTGPSHQSQMEEAAEFLDTLISNLPNLPVAPPQAAKLLALAIQMRNLGPKGDQMAEIIAPADNTGQNAMAMAQQLQLQAAQMQEVMGKMQAELQQLKIERAGKILDNQGKMLLKKMDIEAAMAEAEINTKSQVASERNEFVSDMWGQLHDQAHEAGMQAAEQAHERAMTGLQQQHEQALAAQQAANDQIQQQGEQAHEAGMAGRQQRHEIDLAGQQAAIQSQQQANQQSHEVGMAKQAGEQALRLAKAKPTPKPAAKPQR